MAKAKKVKCIKRRDAYSGISVNKHYDVLDETKDKYLVAVRPYGVREKRWYVKSNFKVLEWHGTPPTQQNHKSPFNQNKEGAQIINEDIRILFANMPQEEQLKVIQKWNDSVKLRFIKALLK